jgi:pseudouridine-5'-phosphate glycosidase
VPPPTIACIGGAHLDRRGIAGKAVTPYILARLVEITNGRSLRANIALAQSNARPAAELAAAWLS